MDKVQKPGSNEESRKLNGYKRGEVTEGWRKLNFEKELFTFLSYCCYEN
jgi:hypothetical protein